jgi:hypothetical protein
MNAPLGALNAPTPTELEAHKRRQAFRDKIAAAAAALKASKLAPEAMPAETDPPKVLPKLPPQKAGSLAELLAWRTEIDALLNAFTDEVGREARSPGLILIQKIVCRRFGVSRNDMCSARRTANLVYPRQIAMYLCKNLTGFSLPAIGRQFGGRDHTTVLHAVRKFTHLVNTNAEIAAEVQALEKIILGEGEAP